MERDYTIVAPDGRELTITGPDNATPQQLRAAAERAFGVASVPSEPQKPELMQRMHNLAAGAVRGAGSIGATLLAPIDVARDALAGKGLTLQSNRQRRADMDAALRDLGVDTDSMAFGAGKIGGEIAGTLGVGPALATGARAVPFLARTAPNVINAIEAAGMAGGSMPARMVGGAITGGVSAGLVNPEDAGSGAAIGGVAPPVMKAAGVVGEQVGRVISGPKQTPEMAAAIQKARQAGYVIPPTQARPTLRNRMLEGFAGKLTTAQNASAANDAVTRAKAATALGLPADTTLSPDILKNVRDVAGQAYDAIGNTGIVTAPQSYITALDNIAQPHITAAAGFPNAKPSPVIDLVESLKANQFDAAAAIGKIKELRSAADDAFRTGNTDIGRAAKQAAKALEDVLEDHLQQLGQPDALQQFREARQLIAKTYSVEKAMNPTTGAIDARKLADQLKKGKPLSGGLKEAAEFAGRFPKAVQPVEQMGSLPQTSPLDWGLGGLLTMATAAATGNSLAALGMLGVAARPAARSAILSPMVQNRLIQPRTNALTALADPEIQRLLARSAPVLAADR